MLYETQLLYLAFLKIAGKDVFHDILNFSIILWNYFLVSFAGKYLSMR
jgi:hypothetical protein